MVSCAIREGHENRQSEAEMGVDEVEDAPSEMHPSPCSRRIWHKKGRSRLFGHPLRECLKSPDQPLLRWASWAQKGRSILPSELSASFKPVFVPLTRFLRHSLRLILLLLAFALWCGRLSGPSFWIDEQVAAEIAHEPTVTDVWRAVAARERRPPGDHLLLYAWRHAAGESDFALRYPSLMAGMLALAVTMRLGQHWLGSYAALRGGLFIATSPFLALYVPMARYYSLTWLLVATSWLVLYRWLNEERDWRIGSWAAYVGVTLALAYTDAAIVPTLTGQGIWLLFSRRGRLRRWLLTGTGIGLALLPWVAPTISQSTRELVRADLSTGMTGMALRLAAPTYIWSLGEATLPWQPIAWLGLMTAGALTLWTIRARSLRLWLGIGVAMPLLFTAGLIGIFAPDITFLNVASRALYAAPALYLAWGATLSSSAIRRSPFMVRPGLALAGALLLANLSGLTHLWRGQGLLNPIYAVPAREIAVQVSAQARPGDLFLADGDSVVARYWPAAHPVRLIESRSPEALATLRTCPRRVWLLTLGRDRTRDMTPLAVINYLEAHYRQTAIWGFVQVDPTYRQVKTWLLRRSAYEYKATLALYDSPVPHDSHCRN